MRRSLLSILALTMTIPVVAQVPPAGVPGPSAYALPGYPSGNVLPGASPSRTNPSRADSPPTFSLNENGQTPNAAAQGFDDGQSAAQDRAVADALALSTPRQRGRRVSVPGPHAAVAHDPALAAWCDAWKGRLMSAGVGAAKIDFEARRLDAEAFAHWGSRQLMVVHDHRAPGTGKSQPAQGGAGQLDVGPLEYHSAKWLAAEGGPERSADEGAALGTAGAQERVCGP